MGIKSCVGGFYKDLQDMLFFSYNFQLSSVFLGLTDNLLTGLDWLYSGT